MMNRGTYIYLAGPYTHESGAVRMHRFEELTRKAGELMKDNQVVFSPITHGHTIARYCNVPTEFDWWQEQCLTMLEHSSKMIVLCLDGWRESKGVAAEIAHASDLSIPIEFCGDDRAKESVESLKTLDIMWP